MAYYINGGRIKLQILPSLLKIVQSNKACDPILLLTSSLVFPLGYLYLGENHEQLS